MSCFAIYPALSLIDVEGEIFYVMDLNGEQVTGLSLQPKTCLAGETLYTVTVKGGAAGVTATDGRQMPADYQRSFTTGAAVQAQLFLRLAVR